MENNVSTLKKQLEKELKECIQKFSTNTKIYSILRKADSECILLSDEAINAKGFRGLNAFALSIWNRDDFSVQYIINNYPNLSFDLHDKNYESNNLFLALRHDYLEVGETLIDKGFSINQRLDKNKYDGNTIFMQLCNPKPFMSFSESTMIFILDYFKPNLNLLNEKGQNAYDILIEKCPSHCRENFTLLLKKAVDECNVLQEKEKLEQIIEIPKKSSLKLKV
jgi:hypothetical protein